jgi:conserved hypothetical protein TIGR00294
VLEVQDLMPNVPLDIERVGFRGVRRRVSLYTPRGPLILDVYLSLYVDVPVDRRGVHLSRSVEVLYEVLSIEGSSRSLEEYLEGIAVKLLDRHSYASRVWASAKTVYYVDVDFEGLTGVEPVGVDVEVMLERGGGRRWVVGVDVTGLTVCPSAQESIASRLGLDARVAPSHMQRVLLKGRVETIGSFVRIEKIARALYRSLSAPSLTLLKRHQEAQLVINALRRPKLIEDVVREAVINMATELSKLPDDTVLEVEALSLESIHPHDLYAYKRATLGRVRSLIQEQAGGL